jgi:hypothetical protein
MGTFGFLRYITRRNDDKCYSLQYTIHFPLYISSVLYVGIFDIRVLMYCKLFWDYAVLMPL